MSRTHLMRSAARSPVGFPGELLPGRPPAAPAAAPPTLAALTERAERFGHRFQPAPASPAPAPRGDVIQGAIGKNKRVRKSAYRRTHLRHSSKFRFIRYFRRSRTGFATKAKAGINLFTVKYKKNGKSYYLTTRSVPSTNASSFNLPSGHSEQRFRAIKSKFLKKHGLTDKHFKWGATEREPCGLGPGMADCRDTLSNMGLPDDKIYFGHEYADREDMRSNPKESASSLNEKASEHRAHHNEEMEDDVRWLGANHDSDSESEDDDDVVDEYESDYGEKDTPRRKRPVKKLSGAFREGFDDG